MIFGICIEENDNDTMACAIYHLNLISLSVFTILQFLIEAQLQK